MEKLRFIGILAYPKRYKSFFFKPHTPFKIEIRFFFKTKYIFDKEVRFFYLVKFFPVKDFRTFFFNLEIV